MSSKFLRSVLSSITLIVWLISSNPVAQAALLSSLLDSYRKSREQQTIADDYQHYISLRWLVYMLILSLPIAPSQLPVTDKISIPVPQQIPPPQIAMRRRTDR